jgi:6-pyruvoyl-tetrahydropterin synthase
MNTFNDILPSLIKKFPSIVSKETIEGLVLKEDKNALSFECAFLCMSELDSSKESRSQEATASFDTAGANDYETEKEKDFTLEEAVRNNFANVKFKALVDHAKKEDTFLYTEFTDIDSARNRIASEIISKYENEFNSFLVALKTAEGVDKSVIESLIQTKIHVGELN